MSEHELILYDRSRVTTDWTCPRKRYLQYELDGKGIVNGNAALELYMGQVLHDGLAAIAGMWKESGKADIDLIATTAQKQMFDALTIATTGEVEEIDFAAEQSSLVEGLLRGFYRQVWPSLIAAYPTILHIEEEMLFSHNGLGFMAKPDLVLADVEGNVWYIEYKSTSYNNQGWVNSWETAVQLHSTVKAIEVTTGTAPTGVIVQGLYKGSRRYGKQSSPFCYAYHRSANPPFVREETLYEYKAGFKRVPVWSMEGGTKAWVEAMPEDVLINQFPQVPPIFIKDYLVEAFFQQRDYREHEINLATSMLPHADDEARASILDVAFPQRFDQCRSPWGDEGRPCDYLRICHGNVADPLQEGYVYRTPHHAPEAEEWTKRVEEEPSGQPL